MQIDPGRTATGLPRALPSLGLLVYLLVCGCDADKRVAVSDDKKTTSESNKEPPVKEDLPKTIVLKDIHPLYGGNYLFLRSDGSGFCRLIKRQPQQPGLHEKRFDLPPSPGTMKELAKLLRDHSFLQISMKSRPGIPDEARPTITVTLPSGESATIAKWANDKHLDFDAVYQALLEQLKGAQRRQPTYEGPYDPRKATDSHQ
jgi:hypothetical protein